jgi:CubicO group peptidase (beta-lactamase class C family)
MTLVERHKLDVDRPINEYLGAGKLRNRAGGSPPTVRQVLNHTSGLPLHYQFFYEDGGPFATPPPREESIRRYGNLIRPPGERHETSVLASSTTSSRDFPASRMRRT